MRVSWLIVAALALPRGLAAQTPTAPPLAALSLSEALQQARKTTLYLQRLNDGPR
jgi:hypothetical protein